MSETNKTARKLTGGVVTVILLLLCLGITTFALVYSMLRVDDNLFQTGIVKLNLNDGEPVIKEDEFLFEPGMRVQKTFFLKNESSCDVYYKLYFENVEGKLGDILDVTIKDQDETLYQGKLSSLTKEAVGPADDILKLQEQREFTILFYFPKETGNEAQNLGVSFDLSADAVQTKNNPERKFQ